MATKPYRINSNTIPSHTARHIPQKQQQRPLPPFGIFDSNNNSDDFSLHRHQHHSKRERHKSPQFHNSNISDTTTENDSDDRNGEHQPLLRQQRQSMDKRRREQPRKDTRESSSSTQQQSNISHTTTRNIVRNTSETPKLKQPQSDQLNTPLPPFSPQPSTPTKKKGSTPATKNDNRNKQKRRSSSLPPIGRSRSRSAAAAATTTTTAKSRSSSLADPNRTDNAGRTKLFAYTISGHLDKIKDLVVHGADVNFKDHAGWVPLHEAALKGQYAIARYLIDCGANVNTRGYGDETPLHDACFRGHVDIVQLLVDCGADVFALNADKQQPLDVCGNQACGRIVKDKMKQLDRLIARDSTGRTDLHRRCADGLYKDVATLVNQGANVNAEDNDRWTPLHEAVRHGHLPIVRLLVQHGADINHVGSQGTTVLHHACQSGHRRIVCFLMDQGINIHAENDVGKTAYQTATNASIRRDLAAKIDDERKRRAASDAVDEITFTTLRRHQLSSNSSSSMPQNAPLSREERKIQAIIKSFEAIEQRHSSRPPRTSKQHYTTTTAMTDDGGRHDQTFGSYSNDRRQKGTSGSSTPKPTRSPSRKRRSRSCTPRRTRSPSRKQSMEILDMAPLSSSTTSSNSKNQTKQSNATKLDPNKRDMHGRTQLHLSATRGDLDRVQKLLQAGADPNAMDYAGYTPLHESALHGHSGVVKILLESGAKVDTKDADLETALHDAIDKGHGDVVAILLQFGADPDLENSKGMTPMETARQQRLGDIQMSLEQAILNRKRKSAHNELTLSTPSPLLSYCRQTAGNWNVATTRQSKKRRTIPGTDLEQSLSSPICPYPPTPKLHNVEAGRSPFIANPSSQSASTPTLRTTSKKMETTTPPLSPTYEPHTPIPALFSDDQAFTNEWNAKKGGNDDKAIPDLSRNVNGNGLVSGDETTTAADSQSQPQSLPLYTVQLVEDNSMQDSLYVLDLQVALLLNLPTDTFWQRYPNLRRRQVAFKEKERLWSPLASVVCTAAQVATPSPSSSKKSALLAATRFLRDQEKRRFLDLPLYFVPLDSVIRLIKQDYDYLSSNLITVTLDIGSHQDQPQQQQQRGSESTSTLTNASWLSIQHLNNSINNNSSSGISNNKNKSASISKTPLKKRPTLTHHRKFH